MSKTIEFEVFHVDGTEAEPTVRRNDGSGLPATPGYYAIMDIEDEDVHGEPSSPALGPFATEQEAEEAGRNYKR